MYYDGTKLLSMLDIDGNVPEIIISNTNRTAGKTTFFNRYLIKNYLTKGKKFMLIFRHNNELKGVADSFFKDIEKLFFQGYVMSEKSQKNGTYIELFLNECSCGYAISLNSAEKIKKISHIFNDVEYMLFDEFQSINNDYLTNEVDKLISVHTSISRGRGEMKRFVKVIMLGNNISLLNPYYVALGISSRLNNAKYLRGKGYVCENIINSDALNAQKNSLFNQAFRNARMVKHEGENAYLNDNFSLIQNLNGKNTYVCTFKCCGVYYCIRNYTEENVLYVSKNCDTKYPVKLAATSSDIDAEYLLSTPNNNFLLLKLRKLFECGLFRFKDIECKESLLKLLSY